MIISILINPTPLIRAHRQDQRSWLINAQSPTTIRGPHTGCQVLAKAENIHSETRLATKSFRCWQPAAFTLF